MIFTSLVMGQAQWKSLDEYFTFILALADECNERYAT